MSPTDLKTLLRQAIRYIAKDNQVTRDCYINPSTGRIEPRSVALTVAKTDMWLSRARRATKRSKRK